MSGCRCRIATTSGTDGIPGAPTPVARSARPACREFPEAVPGGDRIAVLLGDTGLLDAEPALRDHHVRVRGPEPLEPQHRSVPVISCVRCLSATNGIARSTGAQSGWNPAPTWSTR